MIVNAHQLLAADFVTTDEGTGLVHLTPAFGEENAVTDAVGIEVAVPIDSAGQFTAEVPPDAGMQVRDANRTIIRDLRDGAPHVGSLGELERDFGVRPVDLHRPFVDQLTRSNPDDPTGRSTSATASQCALRS
jgi:hypothetical protein